MSIGKMTVQDFCVKHHACEDRRKWAVETGTANMAELWKRADLRIEWRLWIFEHSDVDQKTAVRFAIFCARQNWSLLTDKSSKDAIKTVERWLDGKAMMEEVSAAWAAARDSARDPARDPARAAAWAATSAAASAAAAAAWNAWDSAWNARDSARAAAAAAAWNAWDSASAAASAAAWNAWDSAWDSARAAQSKWLIENVTL